MSAKVATKGKHSAPGEGNVYARANLATAKVTAADTNGAFEVFDEQCKPGFQSRLHLHTRSFQTCYVMEGTGEFLVGDELFQRKCYARIRALQDGGAAVLFVSHATAAVIELCGRAVLLDDYGSRVLHGLGGSIGWRF